MSRLVLDENLSPQLAGTLRDAGHDAVHVNDVGLRMSKDTAIMEWAKDKGRTVVTQDSDFADHLRRDQSSGPSVIHLSQRGDRAVGTTDLQAEKLRSALPGLDHFLTRGASVDLDRSGFRVDPLPLSREREPAATRSRADDVLQRVRERRPDPAVPGRER